MHEHATLVVIEYGAAWPRWLDPSRLGDIAVVAQHYEGEPHSLVKQVENRLTHLVLGQWRIESAVLVSNGRTDVEALAARSIVARGLLSHLRKTDGKRLVLAVSEERGEKAVKTLMALADTLRPGAAEGTIDLLLAGSDHEHHPVARALLVSNTPPPRSQDEPAPVSGFDPSSVPELKLGGSQAS